MFNSSKNPKESSFRTHFFIFSYFFLSDSQSFTGKLPIFVLNNVNNVILLYILVIIGPVNVTSIENVRTDCPAKMTGFNTDDDIQKELQKIMNIF